jgi:hypothetical protein
LRYGGYDAADYATDYHAPDHDTTDDHTTDDEAIGRRAEVRWQHNLYSGTGYSGLR